MRPLKQILPLLLLSLSLLLTSCALPTDFQVDIETDYAGEAYAVIDGNIPSFDASELTTEPFETYAELDALGRCGTAYANICPELMPTEERSSIGQVKPSGWQTVRYDGVVDGNYLYNRCHLIGYQLAGENANEQNLITGTRYMNVEGGCSPSKIWWRIMWRRQETMCSTG